jgi:hypothetical protein
MADPTPPEGSMKTVYDGTQIYAGDPRTQPFTETELMNQFTLFRGRVYEGRDVPYDVWAAEWHSWMDNHDRQVIESYIQRMESNGSVRYGELREAPQITHKDGKPLSITSIEKLIDQAYADARTKHGAFSSGGAFDAATQIMGLLQKAGVATPEL